MRVSMKKNLLGLSIAAITTLALSGSALAEDTNLDVNFTANIRETTCQMKLVGGAGSDTQQTLTIGNNGQVRLDDIKAGTANANFKIVIVECPSSLNALKTKVNGRASTYLPSGIVNQAPTGAADYASVEIARADTPEAPFIIGSNDPAKSLVWTPTEIQNKEVSLVATLRETQAGKMTIGEFQAVATFEFSYE